MIESKNRRRFLSSLVAVLLLALFLFCGKDSWLLREAVVSVGLKTSVPQTCRVFWTERAGEPFVPERSESVRVNGRGVSASFRISANRVETLRIDFGNGAGTVRAGPVLVSGKDERVLDWNDFAERHDIARFDVDAKRAVDIEPAGEHPRAVHAKPVGVSARIRICAFPMLCLVLLSALVWFSLAGPRGLFWNASPSQGETVCTKAFLMLATLLVVVRFAISFRIPAWFTGSPWDLFFAIFPDRCRPDFAEPPFSPVFARPVAFQSPFHVSRRVPVLFGIFLSAQHDRQERGDGGASLGNRRRPRLRPRPLGRVAALQHRRRRRASPRAGGKDRGRAGVKRRAGVRYSADSVRSMRTSASAAPPASTTTAFPPLRRECLA